jgi:ribonuclease HI
LGGRLQKFWKVWESEGADPWVVSTLREGYALEFESDPILSSHPLWGLNSRHPQVDLEIQEMVNKGALEEVENPKSPGFYSRIFVVPKTNGKWRPVIDLKSLNQCLHKKPFRMETGQSIRRSLQKGMWTYSVDLKDAYFQVPIHPSSRKYLRLCHKGIVYQFRALPFGLATAPWLFTKVFRQVAIMLRKKSVMLHQYLDDWLGKSMDTQVLIQNREVSLELIQRLGCVINWEKSELRPTQNFEFVGIHYDLAEAVVSPALEKLERIRLLSTVFLEKSQVRAVKWQKLIGLLSSLEAMVPWGRIHLRAIQLNLNLLWSPQKQPQYHLVPVWEESREEILWWLNEKNLFKGSPLHHPDPQVTVCTDASMEGWGAHSDNWKTSGYWSQQEKSSHINVLEMKAVTNALRELNPSANTNILVKSDNNTVVAYINKQGGTRSVDLMLEVYQLFQLLQERNLTLRARYLPGIRNVLADSLSRKDQILPSEWSLHPQLVEEIFRVWEKPLVDLFATAQNKKLPIYVSPMPDPQALREDALSMSWEGLIAYAYPPTAIMGKVLEKVLTSHCQVILIAPLWPAQAWFQDLLRLSVKHPIRLPCWPKMLKQTGKNLFHTNPEHLKLHAWMLKSNPSEHRESLERCQTEFFILKETPREISTGTNGDSFVIGVRGRESILSRPLYL